MIAFCRYVRFSVKAIIGCEYLKNAQHAGASNISTMQAMILLNSISKTKSLLCSVHKSTTTTAILWPLYRSICISWHLQLRTAGFCWCKVCRYALADGNQDTGALFNSVIYTTTVYINPTITISSSFPV